MAISSEAFAASPSVRSTDTESVNDALSLEDLAVQLAQVRSELASALESQLAAKGVGLGFTQYLILRRLALQGPMAAGELGHAVELGVGGMTRQLDLLEAKGYLSRKPHEQDRRALRIELTPSGLELSKELARHGERISAVLRNALPPSERAHLRDALERVLSSLHQGG